MGAVRARLPVLMIFLALVGVRAAVCQTPGRPSVSALQSGADVLMEWQALPGADGYKVYRTEDPAMAGTMLADTAAVSYTDAGVVPGPPANPRIYYYYVTDGALVVEHPCGSKLNDFAIGEGLAYFLNSPVDIGWQSEVY